MTREELIALAKEARLGTALCHNSIDGDRIWIEGADWHDEVEHFAALVAAKEREECAGICERFYAREMNAAECAAAIRAGKP